MNGYGSSYTVSWWGDVNAPNGWGWVYPFDSNDSNLRADTTLFKADTTRIKADATQI